jgi:hypothetical protein
MAGCSQDEDVVSPISTTELTLSVLRLPTPPPGMIYELWAANSTDTLSLGKFSYDPTLQRFLDESGAARENVFTFNGDLFSYKSVFVSVEVDPDNDLAEHGPIMLIDDVSDPKNSPFQLTFPLSDSLWEGFARLNMEGVSDRSRSSNDGNGIWFSRYDIDSFVVPNTFAMSSGTVDTMDSTGPDSVTFITEINDIETTIINVEQNPLWWSKGKVWLGAQPLLHYGLNYTFVSIKITPPYSLQVLKPNFTTGNRKDFIERFSQDYDALPDYTKWGWKYKGWVVLAHYNSEPMTTRWRITPPAWRYKSDNFNWIPGDTGVLFTTGGFAKIDSADDANPYKLDGPIPPYPGEDFLNSTALQAAFGINTVDIMPNQFGNIGTVFISLEPNNAVSDTTNFPLILMTRELPSSRDLITDVSVRVSMMNRSGTLDNDPLAPGFPQIDVAVKRF